MRSYSKYFISLYIIIISTLCIDSNKTYQEIARSITGAHTRVFAKDNLFEKPIEGISSKKNQKDLTETQVWDQMLDGVTDFVTKKAQGDTQIIKTLHQIIDLAHQLVNAQKIIYQIVFADKNKRPSKQTIDQASFLIAQLQKKRESIQKNIDDLKKATYWIKRDRVDARNILSDLFFTLDLTVNAMTKSFMKNLSAKLSQH